MSLSYIWGLDHHVHMQEKKPAWDYSARLDLEEQNN